jgi:DNA-binding CsgD family transcriptional regulator
VTKTGTLQSATARSELLARVSRAPDALAMFAAASPVLRSLVSHDAAAWRTVDPLTGLMTAPVRTENLDERGCTVYWDSELTSETVNLFSDLARTAVPVAGLRDSTGDAPRRSAVYHGFLRPRGFGDELRAVLRVGGRPRGHLSLFRAADQPAFDRAELEIVAGLSAPLAQRLRSYAEPLATRTPAAATGPGTLLFDPTGALVSISDEARRHLADVPGGPVVSTALGIDLPLWVQGVVDQARAVAQERSRGAARIRVGLGGGRYLVCDASFLRGADEMLSGVAVVVEPATASDVRPLVADAYGLTERELEITERVSRGLPTGEIAHDLFLSPHTVRDHIKTVFDKVGVTSRGQLVAKLFTEQYEPAATSQITRVWDR